MIEDIRRNTENLKKNEQRLEDMRKEMEKKEAKIDELQKMIHTKDSKLEDYEIRLGIIEKKTRSNQVIELDNVESMLTYFNLNRNCSEEEIEDAISVRVLEFSPESFVDSSLTQRMTDEEREKITSQLNRAQQILLDWKRKMIWLASLSEIHRKFKSLS